MPKCPKEYFGTSAEVSGHFGTSAEVSLGHFGTGGEVSWVRSVCTPDRMMKLGVGACADPLAGTAMVIDCMWLYALYAVFEMPQHKQGQYKLRTSSTGHPGRPTI